MQLEVEHLCNQKWNTYAVSSRTPFANTYALRSGSLQWNNFAINNTYAVRSGTRPQSALEHLFFARSGAPLQDSSPPRPPHTTTPSAVYSPAPSPTIADTLPAGIIVCGCSMAWSSGSLAMGKLHLSGFAPMRILRRSVLALYLGKWGLQCPRTELGKRGGGGRCHGKQHHCQIDC